MTMTVRAETLLGELTRQKEAAVKDVLARFGVIHCQGCAVETDKTVAQICREKNLPIDLLLNALSAAMA